MANDFEFERYSAWRRLKINESYDLLQFEKGVKTNSLIIHTLS